ncbi:hypothetical protein LINPERPRIM_LOCUS36238 [Linum perenne]
MHTGERSQRPSNRARLSAPKCRGRSQQHASKGLHLRQRRSQQGQVLRREAPAHIHRVRQGQVLRREDRPHRQDQRQHHRHGRQSPRSRPEVPGHREDQVRTGSCRADCQHCRVQDHEEPVRLHQRCVGDRRFQ